LPSGDGQPGFEVFWQRAGWFWRHCSRLTGKR
jgi:hypothetical protein